MDIVRKEFVMKKRRFFNCIIFVVIFILIFASGCFYENIVPVPWKTVNKSFESLNETECYASENPEVIITYSSEKGPIGRLNKDNEYIYFDIRCEIGYDSFEFFLENYSYEDYLSFECIALDKNTMVLKATEFSQEEYLKFFDDDQKTYTLTLKRRELKSDEAVYLKDKIQQQLF